MLTPTRQLIDSAQASGGGVLAFNVLHLESAEALAGAAEDTGISVILQISQNCVSYHGALEPIALAALAVARASTAHIAVHLDHADDIALIERAIDLGFSSVMYDGSALDDESNAATTRLVVHLAHAHDVLVEAELGEVGGKDGVHSREGRTDPDSAAAFVAATGVDALAVAVGSSHAMTDRTATLDLDLIRRHRDSVAVPLVLHGSSGVPDTELVRAIAAGITKVNVSTLLVDRFTGAVRHVLADQPRLVDSRVYLGNGRSAVRFAASDLLRSISTAGAGVRT